MNKIDLTKKAEMAHAVPTFDEKNVNSKVLD